jgi:hypothetical protein
MSARKSGVSDRTGRASTPSPKSLRPPSSAEKLIDAFLLNAWVYEIAAVVTIDV